jgi:hypothetical protein
MKCKFSRYPGRDPVRSMEKGCDTEASGNCATRRRKRRRLFEPRQRMIAGALLSCALFLSIPTLSEGKPDLDEGVVLELSALGKQGEEIARARGQVLEILEQDNACTAWFKESDPDPAEVFRSLHFELERNGPSLIYGRRDPGRGLRFKHPWGAKSFERGGRNSVVLLNGNGPFFNRTSIVMQGDSGGTVARPSGSLLLSVSSYAGSTPQAQIVILLHELGHITERLPEDDDSWDGRSSRNTAEVLRHCKVETQAAARNRSRSNN